MILFNVKIVFSIFKMDCLVPWSCKSFSDDLGVESDDFSTFSSSMYLYMDDKLENKSAFLISLPDL